MRKGVLVPQRETGRLDIRFSPTEYYGGLHCGETFEVQINGKWIPTRIEMGITWYLVGVPIEDLIGLIVRI
ncbi:DUF5348 domain-containing protein [Ruminococcus sp.]|uniref:DUF5348 domain-containing protein n=1 Tax=Ruminococcus sp. TaxID=41978 RepID=UPI003F03BD8F